MTTSREKLGLLLGFLGTCLFAGTLPATRLAVTGLDPFFLTVSRATIAGIAGVAVLLVTRRRLPPRRLWVEVAAAAVCTVLAFPLLAALAMVTVPAAHGGVVLGILPLATAAAVLAHDRHADAESEPRASPGPLGREKRIEQLRQSLRLDPGPVVLDRGQNACSLAHQPDLDSS